MNFFSLHLSFTLSTILVEVKWWSHTQTVILLAPPELAILYGFGIPGYINTAAFVDYKQL